MGRHDDHTAQRFHKPEGGYRVIPARHIYTVWSAYRTRMISLLGLRVYLALHEVAERRHADGFRGHKRPSPASPSDWLTDPVPELYQLVGCARPSQVRAALRQLVSVGLVGLDGSRCGLVRSPANASPVLQQAARSMERRLGRRGRVPFPRRTLRQIARECSAAEAAVMLGTAMRCLYRHDEGQCSTAGSCSARLLANAFGLHVRTVKAARMQLRQACWLVAIPADPWHVQRFGGRFQVNMAWSPSNTKSSPRFMPNHTEPPPPIIKQELHSEIETRKPDVVAKKHSSAEVPVPPTLARIVMADLRDSGRLTSLFQQAVARGHVRACEADRLRFFAAAEHALRVGHANPCGLFAQTVRQGLWRFSAERDEERARRRLRGLTSGMLAPDVAPPHDPEVWRLVRRVAHERSWPRDGVRVAGVRPAAHRLRAPQNQQPTIARPSKSCNTG